jgi:transmembrane sensor
MDSRSHIEEDAARWVMWRDDPDWRPEDETELRRWLSASPAHKAAFWRLEHGYSQLNDLEISGDLQGRVRRVRARAGWPSPVPWALAASLAVAVLTSVLALRPPWHSPPPAQTYATSMGQRSTVTLPDGSRIELDAKTSVRVAQTDKAREVWLDEGEGYFEIATDPSRPFVVRAGDAKVTVLGTKFDVSRASGQVTVTVLEGRVGLNHPSGERTGYSTLTPGTIAVSSGRSTVVTVADVNEVEDRLAWRQGIINFRDTRLADAVARFNRYSDRQIVVSEDAADIRIGGAFELRNIDGFVRLLQQAYGLRVTVLGDQIRISGL